MCRNANRKSKSYFPCKNGIESSRCVQSLKLVLFSPDTAEFVPNIVFENSQNTELKLFIF